eukprot:Gb_17860 [translate_table: standard]
MLLLLLSLWTFLLVLLHFMVEEMLQEPWVVLVHMGNFKVKDLESLSWQQNYTIAVDWLGQLTRVLGNLSLLSYFAKKRETRVVVVQAVGVVAIYSILVQLAMPSTPFIITFVVVDNSSVMAMVRLPFKQRVQDSFFHGMCRRRDFSNDDIGAPIGDEEENISNSAKACESTERNYYEETHKNEELLSSELCLPTDALVEMEWLSSFIEDSFLTMGLLELPPSYGVVELYYLEHDIQCDVQSRYSVDEAFLEAWQSDTGGPAAPRKRVLSRGKREGAVGFSVLQDQNVHKLDHKPVLERGSSIRRYIAI